MEAMRKWLTTVALCVLATGVLLIGLRGFVPDAVAQSTPQPLCEKVAFSQHASKATDLLTARRAAGHTQFGLSSIVEGAILVCSW